MKLPLEFHPLVQDEIIDSHDWYEQHRPGLGREFLDEVERVLADITANPAQFGFAESEIREGLLSRFPFAVYYRSVNDRIRVLAVYHASRDPSGWKSRG